jgi:hypothetical protein
MKPSFLNLFMKRLYPTGQTESAQTPNPGAGTVRSTRYSLLTARGLSFPDEEARPFRQWAELVQAACASNRPAILGSLVFSNNICWAAVEKVGVGGNASRLGPFIAYQSVASTCVAG